MNQTNVYNEYKKNEVNTASQSKLVLMLYDGAIKNVKLAQIAISDKQIEKANTHIKKAQDIISEFMSTLNFEQGGEVAEGLYHIYDFIYRELIRANINKDNEILEDVRGYIKELRDTWEQI